MTGQSISHCGNGEKLGERVGVVDRDQLAGMRMLE